MALKFKDKVSENFGLTSPCGRVTYLEPVDYFQLSGMANEMFQESCIDREAFASLEGNH